MLKDSINEVIEVDKLAEKEFYSEFVMAFYHYDQAKGDSKTANRSSLVHLINEILEVDIFCGLECCNALLDLKNELLKERKREIITGSGFTIDLE